MEPKKVKRIREALGLTQQQMADRLGLNDRSQVHHLETGRTAATGAKLILLENLGVKLAQMETLEKELKQLRKGALESLESELKKHRQEAKAAKAEAKAS